MCQFLTMSSEASSMIPIKESSIQQIAKLRRIIAPHHYIRTDSLYGYNDISKLCRDAGYDQTLWPDIPAASVITKERTKKTEYYQNLISLMMDAYTEKAIQTGVIKSFQEVTKETPLFDLSKLYHSSEIEPYSEPILTLYEDEIDHLRLYGWQAFLPCLNRFTIRMNSQRYLYIEVTARDPKEKYLELHIEDYAGNRRRWIREGTADFGIQFKNTNRATGKLPMGDGPKMITNYEDFLTDNIPLMGWNSRQEALWRDVLGLPKIKNPLFIMLTPTKALMDDPEFPESARNGIRVFLRNKDDIQTLRSMCIMNPEIEMDDPNAIHRVCYSQTYCRLKILYMRLITAVNLEIIQDPEADKKLQVLHERPFQIGRMTVSSKTPLTILHPEIEKGRTS